MTLYRKARFYTLVGLGLFSVAWIAHISIPRASDFVRYQNFLEKSKVIASSQALSSADQKREKVRKDIWFTQEDLTRLHTRLESKSSVLTLLPTEHKLDMIENLEGVSCWMQDKFFLSNGAVMQQMRYFEADSGTYHYMNQQFLAKAVALSIFRMPGTALPHSLMPSEAFLSGIAQNVSFSVSGKAPQLQAQQFKASLKGAQ